MRIARVIAIAISATLFVSAGSAMADGPVNNGTASKKPGKVAKPKKKAAAPKPVEAEPEPVAKTPDPEPVKAPEPAVASAPETKAADSQTPAVSPKKDDGDGKEVFSTADKPISVAPLFGFGTGFARLGVGVRAGYNITENLYVGGQFMYHFGYSYGYGIAGYGGDYSASVFYPSGEFGYDIKAAHGRLDIRPYGGVALIFAHVSGPDIGGKSVSNTDSALGIYPGVAITYDIPNAPVYVGGDARLLFSLNGGDPSFGAFATAGMRF